MKLVTHTAWLILAAAVLHGAPAPAQTFSSAVAIDIPDGPTAASPYPSTIDVAGTSGTITAVRVTLSQFRHRNPDDVGVLLVAPSGVGVRLMSDAGAIDPDDLGELDPAPISTITFSASADGDLPDASANATIGIPSGTYRPTAGSAGPNEGAAHPADWTPPAPTSPYSSGLDAFVGADANGAWSLYVDDDTAGQYGAIESGWSIQFDLQPLPVAPSVDDLAGITLSNGVGALPIVVATAGVAPAELALACSIVPGSENFRVVSGAERMIIAPATAGRNAPDIALACDPQATRVDTTLRCTRSATPAVTLTDLVAVVSCPAAVLPPSVPTVAPLADVVLADGRGTVPVTVLTAGVAPAELRLACTIGSGAGNFRMTGGGDRVLSAPASVGASVPIGLACDPQPLASIERLSCAQLPSLPGNLPPLDAFITCPASGAAVPGAGAARIVPALDGIALLILLLLSIASGSLALTLRER